MTQEQAKELWPVIKLWSEGRQMQCKCKNDCIWQDIEPYREGFEGPAFYNYCEYRIKTEPQYRPWTQSDVCVGMQLTNTVAIIDNIQYLCVESRKGGLIIFGRSKIIDWVELLQYWKYTTDNGKTWQPCGVLV